MVIMLVNKNNKGFLKRLPGCAIHGAVCAESNVHMEGFHSKEDEPITAQ